MTTGDNTTHPHDRCRSVGFHEQNDQHYQCLGPVGHEHKIPAQHWARPILRGGGGERIVWVDSGPVKRDRTPHVGRPHYSGTTDLPPPSDPATQAISICTATAWTGDLTKDPLKLRCTLLASHNSRRWAHADGDYRWGDHTPPVRIDPLTGLARTRTEEAMPDPTTDTGLAGALRKLLSLPEDTPGTELVAEVALLLHRSRPENQRYISVDPASPARFTVHHPQLKQQLKQRDEGGQSTRRAAELANILEVDQGAQWSNLMAMVRRLKQDVTDQAATVTRLDRKIVDRYEALIEAVGEPLHTPLLFGQLLDKVREIRSNSREARRAWRKEYNDLRDELGVPPESDHAEARAAARLKANSTTKHAHQLREVLGLPESGSASLGMMLSRVRVMNGHLRDMASSLGLPIDANSATVWTMVVRTKAGMIEALGMDPASVSEKAPWSDILAAATRMRAAEVRDANAKDHLIELLGLGATASWGKISVTVRRLKDQVPPTVQYPW